MRPHKSWSAFGFSLKLNALQPIAARARYFGRDTREAGSFRSTQTRTMTLNFPNQCRYYDATRRAVQFWGHDSAMEAAFFVTEEALKRVQPNMQLDEAGLLRAFDLNRDTIYAVAAKVYKRGKRSYDLVSTDF